MNVPDSSDENADCFEDEPDLATSIHIRWVGKWVDMTPRMTRFLSFLMR
jgi:hypothetical protein